MPGRPTTGTETKEERTRTRTTKQYSSNSSNLVEDIAPQILLLDTKPFVIFTDASFQVDAYFKVNGLIVVYETRIFILSWNLIAIICPSVFLLRLLCFPMCLDNNKIILPLCYKRVIAMSPHKFKEKLLVFSVVCFKRV